MALRIDSHQHFWHTAAQTQPWRHASHTALARDFTPDDLVTELDAAGIAASVLVQSVDEPEENARLARYGTHPRVAGVVAWLPLTDAAAARAALDRLDVPKLVGVRCLIADDPLAWLTEPDSVALFAEIARRGLAWDVVPITLDQTRQVIRLAETVPELRIVVDHLGRPPVESLGWEPWASHIRQLAGCPNVAMKVSVGINALTAWDGWEAGALERYVRFAAELFGAERLMLASNWPVVLLRAEYGRAWADLADLVAAACPDGDDREAVFGGTACRWYGLHRFMPDGTAEGVVAQHPA
ncbi:amidohydrolase [Streptomyces sp. TS71-3]|uniref:amidohydrolase family protein n=1 Tax=Streptomyces sp. TS71-3 TaxID=2733862 RepID=UPI001B24DE2C|nr:amidohydrolase family protein [Streptomyces sp. TS71-3]GHJ39337.1 metal-dependent hydrolase [Streptomyces sp. TS71-3]